MPSRFLYTYLQLMNVMFRKKVSNKSFLVIQKIHQEAFFIPKYERIQTRVGLDFNCFRTIIDVTAHYMTNVIFTKCGLWHKLRVQPILTEALSKINQRYFT